MNIITDIKYIEQYAKEHDKENWKFRDFLKYRDFENLDDIVHNLYNEVSEKIDCTKCGNCCKTVRPVLDSEDISRFAFGLKIKINEFKSKYIIADKDIPDGEIFNKLPCPFLNDKLCSNYSHRPKNCELYPHLHNDDIVSRLWGIVDNYSVCPIVFNVYEQLKLELWHADNEDSEDEDYYY